MYIDYAESIKNKALKLKKFGISYKAMARESNVGYSSVRNFVNGYSSEMTDENWERFTHYIEMTYLNVLGGRKVNEESKSRKNI